MLTLTLAPNVESIPITMCLQLNCFVYVKIPVLLGTATWATAPVPKINLSLTLNAYRAIQTEATWALLMTEI